MAINSSNYRERGASVIETAISVAMVAIMTITTVKSFGGGLLNSVNSLASALNPPAFSEPEVSFASSGAGEAPNLRPITSGNVGDEKTGAGAASDHVPDESKLAKAPQGGTLRIIRW
jgi:Flp pilus assembly pilin Flp